MSQLPNCRRCGIAFRHVACYFHGSGPIADGDVPVPHDFGAAPSLPPTVVAVLEALFKQGVGSENDNTPLYFAVKAWIAAGRPGLPKHSDADRCECDRDSFAGCPVHEPRRKP